MTLIETNSKFYSLPLLVHTTIASYLTFEEIAILRRVSKLCKPFFDSDIFWEPFAKQLNINKKKYDFLYSDYLFIFPEFLKNILYFCH